MRCSSFLNPVIRKCAAKISRRSHDLEILSESAEAGVYMVASKDGRQIFVTGHSEYDPRSLKDEYDRDMQKGMEIGTPGKLLSRTTILRKPLSTWRAHANLLFSNWLNYYVYQQTPYDLGSI